MRVFLILTMILAGIVTLISIPLMLFGLGIFVVVPLVFFIVLAVKAQSAIGAHKPMSPRVYALYMVATLLAAFACAFGLYQAGSLGNIDTTGKPNPGSLTVPYIVDLGFTISLLAIGYRWQSIAPRDAIDQPPQPNTEVVSGGSDPTPPTQA